MTSKTEIPESDAASYFDALMSACGFLTRLPIPFRNVPIHRAAWAFPMAGVVVGCVAGGLLWGGLAIGLPPLAASILAFIASALVTGALHEDGLADCADGFWGGTTPERRLEIMRDSRSGAYAVLALVLVSGLKIVLLASVAAQWGGLAGATVLVGLHAVSRSVLPIAMNWLPPAGTSGLAVMAGRPSLATACFSLGLGAAISLIVPGWMGIAFVPAGLAVVLAVGYLAKAKLNGINGDSLGAMEQMAEVMGLLVLTVLMS